MRILLIGLIFLCACNQVQEEEKTEKVEIIVEPPMELMGDNLKL